MQEAPLTDPGFQEAQSQYEPATSVSFVGQVRRFGSFGPAYEVLDIRKSGAVAISVIESGERLDYPLDAMLADPLAETIP
jgi:Family of unknown function (DUF5397)